MAAMDERARDGEAFWRFSLDAYGRGKDACLELQDRRGLDVNMLLFCCWRGARGAGPDDAALARADAALAPWRAGVVAPLRGVRDRLGARAAGPGGGAGAAAGLRRGVLDLELAAERIGQGLILDAAGPAVAVGPAVAGAHGSPGPEAAAAIAAGALRRYLASRGVAVSGPAAHALRRLLRAAFPDAGEAAIVRAFPERGRAARGPAGPGEGRAMAPQGPTGTLAELAARLAAGRTTGAELAEAALAAIDDDAGEGARAFTRVWRETARAEARAGDALRAAGAPPGPLSGVPVSVKDLFDAAGETTPAGSVARDGAAPAVRDAPIVARLRAAGAILVGRTNMTEFAFSGLGINPHYGTPLNPWDRATGRIPGGSSSGAAVSVTDGMAAAAIGTDTGGSVRIPSALCGLTGFKPTARRVPTAGAFPLSATLDSIGPLARSVACCALLDRIMAGEPVRPVVPRPVATLTLGAPTTAVRDDMDAEVARAFDRALSRLSAAGARIVETPFEAFARIAEANATGGFAAPEAFATLRGLLAADRGRVDPRVAARIERGAAMSAADYIDLTAARAAIRAEADARSRDFDALLLPTVPVVAPTLAPLEASDDAYHAANQLMLRNCSFGNFLDRCAVSLPVHEAGAAPVGLMVLGETMGDAKTLEAAAGIEAALAEAG